MYPSSDTAVLAQSRFILLETMMILFSLLALYSVIRFRRFHSEPFSSNWWTWITAASFFMGAAFWSVIFTFTNMLLKFTLLYRVKLNIPKKVLRVTHT